MKIIAMETATTVGSIAIVDDEGVISELTLNIKTTHSRKLMTAMSCILEDAGLSLDDMDGIAVSIGPGSFTGLRIALSAAKGLSYSSGKPLIGIPTLDALASNLPFSRYLVCPILDARRGEVYTALYRSNKGSMEKLTDDMAVNPSGLLEMINDETIFLGDGVTAYGDFLKERLGDLYLEASLPLRWPRASNVAMLALKRLGNGGMDNPFAIVPRYIRKSEAELNWKG
ncbi:MAG TPA: tRNA (adenosine(37)-N6)-threonylcarbamoyltransferase complex dimerization subunit type 1 TsaB [Thermodesulfobacteriota bacterium]|nr:tRNA (adenosine(37)-N6)-threonylcarbamoyltransferase complex dimerization subunit type 1 TsaB [Thermodesulfobacteriota bacterium]